MAAQNINQSVMSSVLEQELKHSQTLKESVLSHFDQSKFSIMNKASDTQIFVFQFLGVFLFTYGYSCSISVAETDAQAAGCLFLAIVFSGTICGANINPTITLSNCLKKQNQYRINKFIWFFLGQLLGAVAGVFWSAFLGHKQFDTPSIKTFSDAFSIISNEAIAIYIFVLFMLLLSNPNTTFIDSELSGYACIAVFYQIARSYAPFAGLVINPAVTLASAIRYAFDGNLNPLRDCWAWLLGDLLGCLLGLFFYDSIYQPIVKQLRQIRRKSQVFQSLTEEQCSTKKNLLEN